MQGRGAGFELLVQHLMLAQRQGGGGEVRKLCLEFLKGLGSVGKALAAVLEIADADQEEGVALAPAKPLVQVVHCT